MNENFTDIEKKLESAATGVVLSVSEKSEGRETLQAFMQNARTRSVPSPFAPTLMTWLRPTVALALIFMVGGGVASASESSLPGSPLYPLKVRVVEPIQAALTTSPEGRADFEIERASRRLEEFAYVSSLPDSNGDSDASLAASLHQHVEDARESIADLTEAGDETEALEAASDLNSVLEAHTYIIDRLDDAPGDVIEDENAVTNVLEEALEGSESLAVSLEENVSTASTEEVEHALQEQEEDIEKLVVIISEDLEEQPDSLDTEDEISVRDELAEAEVLLGGARQAKTEGKFSNALALYTDVNNKLNRLSVVIEADAHSGFDILESEEESESLEQD